MNKCLFLVVFLAIASIMGCRQQRQQSAFVKHEGTALTLDGKPYTFVGTNFWYGAILGSEGHLGL